MNCKSLLFLDLSSLETQSVINIGSMLNGCISLKSKKLGNFKTATCTNFGGLFFFSSLDSIDLSNFVTSSAYSMVNMFSECTSLVSLDLSNFRTGILMALNGMLQDYTNLKYLDISNFEITKANIAIIISFQAVKNKDIYFKNFKEGSGNTFLFIFYGVPDDLTYVIDNINNMPTILEELNNKNCSINGCSED